MSSFAPTSERDLMQVTNRPTGTIADSNPLADYFGPLPANTQMRAADGYQLESWVLGDAYEGRNLYLSVRLSAMRRMCAHSVCAKHALLTPCVFSCVIHTDHS